jgi:hypothetical protein
VEIVVVHLTRLNQPGAICVAGVEAKTLGHVRLVLDGKNLTTQHLAARGGPFCLGAVVELGRVRQVGKPPAREDHLFAPSKARRLRILSGGEFWRVLEELARPCLADLFGADLRAHGPAWVVDLGKGRASLGCLKPAACPKLEVAEYAGRKRVRLHLDEVGRPGRLAVTDWRMYDPRTCAPLEARVEVVARKLARGTPAILALGLGRPWKREGDAGELHWLHVNNVHLADTPVW